MTLSIAHNRSFSLYIYNNEYQRFHRLDIKTILIPTNLFPSTTWRHGNFAGVHTLLRILLSSNSAVLINIITGVSPPHFDFVVFYYGLCQC
jgi:hypothetical protein